MNTIATALLVLAVIGSALIGGVFFSFSSFVMRALARVPSAEGISVMQSINVVVLTPSFLGAFMGTAVVSLIVAALSVVGWGAAWAPYTLAAALLYLIGTALVTGLGNVPLNEELAAVSAVDSVATVLWEQYLNRWTFLNSVRATAAVGAALLYTLGLMQSR